MKKLYISFLFLLLIAALYACSSSPSSEAAPAPGTTATPTSRFWQRTATFEVAVSRANGGLRAMTYNVFVGGSGLTGGDTIARIIEIVQSYNPDILAIQEANGWYENDYAIPERIATALDMDYVYCQGASDFADDQGQTFDTIIFTRFEIIDSQAFPSIQHCMGRAEILLPDGSPLQVFNLHVPADRCSQFFPEVVAQTDSYMQSPALLMGDFNVVNPIEGPTTNTMVGCNEILQEAGWKYLGSEFSGYAIDHIWASPPLHDVEQVSYIGRTERLADPDLLSQTSDHNPVAADLFIE